MDRDLKRMTIVYQTDKTFEWVILLLIIFPMDKLIIELIVFQHLMVMYEKQKID
jgi:hypothetical protein